MTPLEKHHRLVRRDLEPAAAAFAVDEVVHAIQMIAQLGEERTAALIGALRRTILLRSPQPFDLIVRPVPALRTRERHRLHLGFFGETIALVHTFIVVQKLAGGCRP